MIKHLNLLLVASNNAGKFIEISEFLLKLNIKPISIKNALPNSLILEPEETGESFAENSTIKARYYALKTGLVSIADDSGLSVKALNGKPGVHSARFAIDENGQKNFEFAAKKIFENLKKLGIDADQKPEAKFVCNLCIYDPNSNEFVNFEGEIDGYLIFPPKGELGFGYDPIFVKNGMTKSFGEILPQEKDQISHRSLAFASLKTWLLQR